jgi:hypothetical protein
MKCAHDFTLLLEGDYSIEQILADTLSGKGANSKRRKD